MLTTRQLNRATLHRQLLLEWRRMPAIAAVEDLVGLQAQVPNVPYLALWSRLRDFHTDELAEHVRERTVVRVIDRLRPRLRWFSTDEGGELVDLPDAPRPDPDTPAQVRFLPEYDNALLSYADRRRVISGTEHVPLLGGPGGYVGTVMVDGFVCAMWAVRRDRASARLEVRPSLRLAARQRDEVLAEASRLLQFVAPDADHDVAFTTGL